jgi:hypothetical protein
MRFRARAGFVLDSGKLFLRRSQHGLRRYFNRAKARFYGDGDAWVSDSGIFAAARNATMLSISGARVGMARIAWVLRLGL